MLFQPVKLQILCFLSIINHQSINTDSCVDPSITKSVFKGFLHRACIIYSEKYIKEKTVFLVDMFVKNGHKKTFLQNLVKDYNIQKKNHGSRSYTISKKIPWAPNNWTKN